MSAKLDVHIGRNKSSKISWQCNMDLNVLCVWEHETKKGKIVQNRCRSRSEGSDDEESLIHIHKV